MATVGTQLLLPEAGWLRWDDRDNRISYMGGGWSHGAVGGDWNNDANGTNTKGAYATFKFYGTKVRIIARANPAHSANISMFLDSLPETVYSIQYGSGQTPTFLAYEKTGLALGVHTVKMVLNDTNWMVLDAIDIDDTGYLISQVGQVLLRADLGWQRFDDNDTHIQYVGSFAYASDGNCYNGTVHVSTVSGNNINFKFYGTKFRLLNAYYTDQCNSISVVIDGGTSENYSSYSSPLQYKTIVYEKQGLTLGEHTVSITSNAGGCFALDAIDIDDTGYLITSIGNTLSTPDSGWRRYNDTDTKLTYTGTWTYDSSDSTTYRSSQHYTLTSGSKLSFKFYGTKLRLISGMAIDRSTNILISIDGVIESFSEYGTSALKQRLVYQKTGLTLTIHTVEVTINQNSLYLDLDCLDVDDTGYLICEVGKVLDTSDYGWIRYDNYDSRITATGFTLEFSSTAYNGSHFVGGSISSSVSFRFYGTKFRYIGTRYISHSTGIDVYVDGTFLKTVSFNGAEQRLTLEIEVLNLTLGIHSIIIKPSIVGTWDFDALDVDGYLAHPFLNQVTSEIGMVIGDCMIGRYTALTAGIPGSVSEIGNNYCTAITIPITGTATPDGVFFLIKTDKGMLIADRVLQTGISADSLNLDKYMEGAPKRENLLMRLNDLTCKEEYGIGTINNAATLSTTIKKIESSSIYINGTNITIANDSVFDFEDKDFTIRFWWYPVVQQNMGLFNGVTDMWFGIGYNFPAGVVSLFASSNGGSWDLLVGDTGSTNGKGSIPITLNTWHHVEACRKGNRWMTFIDGIKDVDQTVAGKIISRTENKRIGLWGAGGYSANAYFNEFEVIKGTALHSASFVPPTTASTVGTMPKFNIRSLSGGSAYLDYYNKRIVSTLLHFDSPDGSSVITDSAPVPKIITSKGGLIKTTKYKFGSSSLYLNGSSSIIIPYDESLNFGNGDFTIEAMVNGAVQTTSYPNIFNNNCNLGWTSESINLNFMNTATPGKPQLWVNSVGSALLTGTTRIDDGLWHHLVITRVNNTVTLFVDGVIQATNTYTGNFNLGLGGLAIGGASYDLNTYYTGYVDEIRLIKGKAEYTANFIPPTIAYTETVDIKSNAYSSTTDKAFGMFPSGNDWDKYVCDSTLLDKITKGDKNIWNWEVQSWIRDTPMLNIYSSACRGNRGPNVSGHYNTSSATATFPSSTTNRGYSLCTANETYTTLGFRPVFEYLETNPKASNLFY